MKYNFDAVIIGGGASGLICAVSAKKNNPGRKVAVVEKNDRVGKKLLSTGNGRCNITNAAVSAENLNKYLGAEELRSVFERFDSKALLKYFKELGLLASADGEGRYYPLSRQASSVLDVLRYNCEQLGVEFFCGEAVKSVSRQRQFAVKTENSVFFADKLVLAVGSPAAPKLGGTGFSNLLSGESAHKTAPFRPILCPVKVKPDGALKSLKGLRAQAEVSLLNTNKAVKTERGEVQFNEDNLSGICVFNLSLHTEKGDSLSVDLLPDISEKELYNILLQNKERFSAQTADNIFSGILQKRIAQAALKKAEVSGFSRKCAELTESELKKAAKSAKALRFQIIGNLGFDRAQSCKGGVKVSGQIDRTTLESRRVKNLYFCGEAIDVCGECGGYNLHFAFATGIIAGEQL